MKTKLALWAMAFMAALATTAAATDGGPMELTGVNGKGVTVVFSPQPWKVCEPGEGSGWIFYLDGNTIGDVWPHQRCTVAQGDSGKLQLSCASEDGPRYSFSQAVFVQTSRDKNSCSYTCKTHCYPHVPATLRSRPMVPIAPPMPPMPPEPPKS